MMNVTNIPFHYMANDVPQPQKQQEKKVGQNINFQAKSTEDRFEKQSVKSDPYAQLLEKQKAAEKKQKRDKILSTVLQAGLVIAITASVALMAYQMFGKKVSKTIFGDVGKMPSLTDDCVNPKTKAFIEKIKNIFTTPKDLLDYTGCKKPNNFVIFHGATGTGKTFSAKLLAKELGAEYGELQFSDISSSYIGESAVNITNKFKEFAKMAKKNPNKKFVVAFNEIDSLINNVEKLGGNNLHLGQNRTAFLNGLDSIKDIPNLMIVGTTNVNPKTANLDPATLSRFGNNIFEIGLPDIKEIKAALKYHMKDSKAAKDLLADDNILEALAKTIKEKGGAQRDIENIAQDAIANFTTAISGKSDAKTQKLTVDFLEDVISKKEVWAANIGKEQMVEQELSRYLENDGLMAKIWEQIAKMSGVK